MARRESKQNKLVIKDFLSATELEIFYRLPTTEERQKYINSRSKRVGDEIVDDTVAARIASGKAIVVGVGADSFEREVKGEWVPLTTEQEDWREWLEDHAPDVLETLATTVFDIATRPQAGGLGNSTKP